MEFKVLKVNEAFRNVVVSHKALIEADIEEQKKEIMSKLEKGQVLEGVVKNTTSYGVFIDLGGVDGLIHITDLSWGRIAHPEEIVTLDEKINVVILDFDEGKKRIQLGLKQLSEHPWNSLDENLKVGDAIKGKVVVVADYGVFVEIQPGIEALLHVSEMSWSTHLRSANDFFKVGDEVDAQILTLDKEERKMSLGIKQMQEDPWSVITKKFPVDSKHNVKVINFTNFGIFVELDEGIDGLVHISDLSWTKKIKHPAEFTSVGEMLDVVVLEIDIENRRISLGHKQLEDNPWDTYETLFIEGNSYKGKIIEMFDKGALIALEHDVEAFAPKRHLEKEGGSSAGVGEELDFKVLEFSKENKKILVSHTDTLKQAEKKAKKSSAKKTKKAVEKIQETQQKSTLGDLDVLSSLKEDIDKKEKDSDSE
jgi:small subunit ribosomal protein S1